ncbi:DUF3324 domain-containing protein [Bombilactobacillus bombi]|uniref:DUF3324 domain-containing protein n=1 Tax=Bombilactobacillus bombi TaxID=1303590 RepID=UPI000E5800D0|nr:DUF3324 domain-containing protein [Bombilactobacillus bombi]AXX64947.1 DUF3324 domain-containing protein [Bombilactobacillus bombi]
MKLKVRNKLSIVFFTLVLALLGVFTSSTVEATETGYALKAVYGTNQVDKNGQIDIFGNPGQTIPVTIAIANQSNADQRFEVNFYTAGTSDNGIYEFKQGIKKDSSMKINAKNYVKPLKQIVTAKANSIQNVSFNITIPTNNFSGYLMGGISVAPYKQKAKTSLTSNGTLIKNKYSQGIPVKIRQDRNNKKDPKFRVLKVVPTANKTLKSRGVLANVQNYVDGYVGNLNVKSTVTRRPDDHKFKVKATANSQDVAPNSNYNLAIDWGKKPLQAGNYHLHMKYTTDDKTKSWIVDKDFSISDADAAKYNKLSGIKPNYMWLWILIAILALLLVLGLGIYFGRRNQNKQQPMNNNMNNQR